MTTNSRNSRKSNVGQGVSVHLPTWADTLGWATREPRVLNEMTTGYPRFFIPRIVERLALQLLSLQGSKTASAQNGCGGKEHGGARLGLVLSTLRYAVLCRQALCRWNPRKDEISAADMEIHIVGWEGRVTTIEDDGVLPESFGAPQAIGNEDIVLVSYPAELAPEAKAFWQHTGFGISSRRATHWLQNAPFLAGSTIPKSVDITEIPHKLGQARAALKRRIAVGHSRHSDSISLSDDDVCLYQTGMTAIVETAAAIKALHPPGDDSPPRVAVFGFVNTTLLSP